jgi:lyso-ornithine lipid O-acyltransferase
MKFRPILQVLRIFRLGYVLGAVILITLLLYPWLAASVLLRYRRGQRLVPKVFHRILRTLLGLQICVQGAPSSRRPLLVVANHTSWLDIVILSSFLPVIFVAKQEVARLPIFGWLAKLQRSIFVNRERRQDVHATIRCVADSLAAGEVVGIFPEGTSTDGSDVSPFRSALIGAVSETLRREQHLSAIFIQPVSVAYVGANQRSAIWALEDEIPFVPHLLQVISLRRIDVAIAWGDPISAGVHSDRKALTRRLEAAVRQLMPKRANREISDLAADREVP